VSTGSKLDPQLFGHRFQGVPYFPEGPTPTPLIFTLTWSWWQ